MFVDINLGNFQNLGLVSMGNDDNDRNDSKEGSKYY
jgi:hypothetical protein